VGYQVRGVSQSLVWPVGQSLVEFYGCQGCLYQKVLDLVLHCQNYHRLVGGSPEYHCPHLRFRFLMDWCCQEYRRLVWALMGRSLAKNLDGCQGCLCQMELDLVLYCQDFSFYQTAWCLMCCYLLRYLGSENLAGSPDTKFSARPVAACALGLAEQ